MYRIPKCLTVIFSLDMNTNSWEIYIQILKLQNHLRFALCKLLCSVAKNFQNLYKSFSVVRWFACNQRWRSIRHRPKRFFARKISRNRFRGTKIETDSVETKKNIKSTNGNKIPRFNLKSFASAYDAMIDFPQIKFYAWYNHNQ